MTDDKNRGMRGKGSRQDRLKQALRANLKRRKDQSKAQSRAQAGGCGSNGASGPPSNLHEAALDEDAGGEPDK